MMQSQGKLASPLAKLSPPGNSATIADWVAWLHNASAAFDGASAGSRVYSGSQPAECGGPAETRNRINTLLDLVRDYMPWLMPEYKPLRDVAEFGINLKSETLTIEPRRHLRKSWRRSCIHAAEAAKSGDSPLSPQLRAALPETPRAAFARAADFREIAEPQRKLAENTEFGFLVNPAARCSASVTTCAPTRSIRHATTCSRPRPASPRSWPWLAENCRSRAGSSWRAITPSSSASHVILSWTGTMFEYLMPSLWMRSYPLTLIARNLAAAVEVQRAYARTSGNTVGHLGIGKCA